MLVNDNLKGLVERARGGLGTYEHVLFFSYLVNN